jgi:hypothetical protein
MSPRRELGGNTGFALMAACAGGTLFLPLPTELGGTFVLALIVGPAACWTVADPAPMSPVMALAAGVGGAIIWGAMPTEWNPPPLLIPPLFTLPPILAAGALLAVYRICTRQAPAEGMKPLGRRWLTRGALVALALFPFAFLAIGTFIAEAGVNLDNRGLLEYLVEPAAGVSLTALMLVAVRCGCGHFWFRRAEDQRKEVPCAPDCS